MSILNTKNELSEISDWLDDAYNTSSLRLQPEKEIESIIKNKIDLKHCALIAFNFSLLRIWLSNKSLLSLTQGFVNSNHMNDWSKFLDYGYYSMSIFTCVLDHPDGKCRISGADLYLLFFALLAFNRHEQALWLGGRAYLGDSPERFSGRQNEVWTLCEVSEWEALGGDVHGWRGIVSRLRRLIPGKREKEASAGKLDDDPMFPYWEEKPLCGYMLRLWLVMSGQLQPQETPDGHPGCGVYEGLFTNWDHPEALENSIIEACDYHVRRSSEDGDGDYDVPEFTLRPYNVIPFEILAYRNVRRKMGLETPWPSHPLLDSPFVKNLPDELPPSDDPLLNEVLAAVRKVLPDV